MGKPATVSARKDEENQRDWIGFFNCFTKEKDSSYLIF